MSSSSDNRMEHLPDRFLKLEGCGNSFVILSNLKSRADIDWQAVSSRVCSHAWGVGADGLLVLKPSRRFDFNVCMYNPDGSLMGMCGNGIRCVVRFLYLEHLVSEDKHEFQFEVQNRVIECTAFQEGKLVRVHMGSASFNPIQIGIRTDYECIQTPLHVRDLTFTITAVSMGNPHCVIFVEDVDAVPLETVGPQIEHDELFSNRTNVEFVQCVSANRLRVRVWERGAGATLACGTGACAAVAAGVRSNLCNTETVVELPGGELTVKCESDFERVFLTGPAHEVFQGKFYPSFWTDLVRS